MQRSDFSDEQRCREAPRPRGPRQPADAQRVVKPESSNVAIPVNAAVAADVLSDNAPAEQLSDPASR